MCSSPSCWSRCRCHRRHRPAGVAAAVRPSSRLAPAGPWAFGFALCMEACPINERLAPAPLEADGASTAAGPVPFPDLLECLQLTAAEFEERFRGTAVWRAGRHGLARNAAIALGNAGDRGAVPALRQAARDDEDEVVREAAAWAVARLAVTRS